MKVLLFTHSVDIDGMGSAVLAKLAFTDVQIEFCDTFEINQKVQKYLKNNKIYEFDRVFVADLCIKQPLLGEIASDEKLAQKLQILDHHKSEIEEGNGNFSFSHIVVEDENGKCSGTSLFYEYVVKNGYLNRTKIIDDFVELTRQYDTWEWKTKYNNERANDLNIVFSMFGIEKYVDVMFNKLLNDEELFDVELAKLIFDYKQKLHDDCLNYISSMHTVTINGYKIGVIENTTDEHKNDIAEKLRIQEVENDLDFVAMEIVERNTISFRTIKEGVDVGAFASLYGGKGHKNAGSCKITSQVIFDLKMKR